MFKFDFIDASAAAYRFAIIEHRSIYQMAIIPLMVKLACFVIITMAGLDEHFLKQGFILIPSYFLEGWLLGQVLRLAILGERWPASLSGDLSKDASLLHERKICLQACTAMYVLMKVITTGVAGWSLHESGYLEDPTAMEEPDAISFFAAFAILVTAIWLFRLLWLYIPLALGQTMNGFLDSIKPYSSSIYMLGTWILCSVPVAFLLLTLTQMIGTALGLEDGQEPTLLFTYIVIVLQAVLELFVAIVSTIAMAYTIGNLTKKTHKKP